MKRRRVPSDERRETNRVLAIDIGTSSTRTALFDATGNRILKSTVQREYLLHTGKDGKAELDPAALLNALNACLSSTLRGAKAVSAVGISCFGHSLIGTDEAGRPLTPVYTWADSRCREQAARLRKRTDQRSYHARSGCMLHTSFWPAKLQWLRATQQNLFKKVSCWMTPADWLLMQLTRYPRQHSFCAHGMATSTGLYNPKKLDWDDSILRLCSLRREQLIPVGDTPRRCTGAMAERFPALENAEFFPPIMDGVASNLGAGATRPGLAAINFGTSAAVRVLRDSGKPLAPFGLFCYRVDAHRFLIGGAISNAGGLRAWCMKQLRLDDEDAIERELAARPTPDHGLKVLPFWIAERAPTWRDDISGAILGISQATTAIDLLQAITEATYQRLAQVAELLPNRGRGLTYIVGGGIQKSDAALQRLADVLGQRVVAIADPETSLRGAAIFALEKSGSRPRTLPGGRLLKPRASAAKAYAGQRTELAQIERTLFPR